MKFFPLVWAGIWRRRGRTVLILLSIINAFVLFGLLIVFSQSSAVAPFIYTLF